MGGGHSLCSDQVKDNGKGANIFDKYHLAGLWYTDTID